MLHIGHILLFKSAKELGDRLVVAVQDSDVILKYKPGTKMIYTTEERMYMVSTIKYVDGVVIILRTEGILSTMLRDYSREE